MVLRWLLMYRHHVRFDALSGLQTHTSNHRIEGAPRNPVICRTRRGLFREMDFRTITVPRDYLSKLAAMLQQGSVGFHQRDFTQIDPGMLIGRNCSQRIWRSR